MRIKDVSELPEHMRANAQAQLQGRPAAAMPIQAGEKRARKYDNEPTNGYASAKESRRADALRLLELAGGISDLREQVPFELLPAQYIDGKCVERSCSYVADFVYTDVATGKEVVEDAKGFRHQVYRIKRKLMLSVHGVRIHET